MVFKRILNWIINFTIIFIIITFSPGLGPKTTFPFEEFTVAKPRQIEPNDLLNKPEILLKGKVHGPEHILEKDGVFFASLADGTVVKITGENVEVLSQFGKFCTPDEKVPMCGRPLGLAFDKSKKDTIIVADSSVGIFELNYVTKRLKIVILNGEYVGQENPRMPTMINSVAVANNGDIYYTETSSDFEINQCFMGLFTNPSGRLIHFDRKTKKARVLIDRLYLANGVALSPNEDFVLVTDFGRNKILKYTLTGVKADTYNVLINNLPGSPDNLTPDEKGFWVAIPFSSDAENMIFYQKLAQYPTIRRFIARILYTSSALFKKLYAYLHVEQFKTTAMAIDSIGTYSFLFPIRSTIMRFNWDGKELASYHAMNGPMYTHVLDTHDGKLYLGSFVNDFIARVDRQNHD